MGRERIDYEQNLLRLIDHFGDMGEAVPLRKAAKYIGISARRLQADKTFPLKKVCGRYYVSLVGLARWLS